MTVTLRHEGHVAILVMDRTEALNALDREQLVGIGKAIDDVAASDARALVIVGAGEKAFCAGADIKELMSQDAVSLRAGVELGQATFAKLDRLGIPSIAVIHGFAFGGGLELAMACTFRVATPKAKLGLPEVKLGLIPGYGGTQRLPRLVGTARAAEIVMSGRTVDAAEASAIGLVNTVVEGTDPIAIGREYASRFIGLSKRALLFARQAVHRALDVSLDEGFRIEADLITLAFQTKDAAEGMTAFLEKRAPRFEDR